MSQIRREGKEIKRLRLLIPTFDCIPGCSDCCGPVPFSLWEESKLPGGQNPPPKPGCLDCPHSTPQGCAVYEDRPIMCRVFGTVDDPRLKCPHGRRPEKLLSKEELEEITTSYAKLSGDHVFKRGGQISNICTCPFEAGWCPVHP